MTIDQICNWLNSEYHGRNWDQQCQRLVWNVVWKLSGISEGRMVTYPTATAARNASTIVSSNAKAAPVGAIHYWRNPAEGHVAVSLGNGKVLMTGTSYALGNGGVQKGNNYGITTVDAYTSRMGNPYLGWAHTNGSNPNIQGKITTNNGSAPAAGNGDDMLINVKGKANARRGGLYFVSGGKATFVGGPVPAGVPLIADENQIKVLQGRISGLA